MPSVIWNRATLAARLSSRSDLGGFSSPFLTPTGSAGEETVAILVRKDMTFYVATTSGLHTVGSSQSLELEGHEVTALHVGENGERWAVLDRSELWRDSGAGWVLVASSDDHRLNSVLAYRGSVWVGASDARLFRLDNADLISWEPFDSAPGRSEWFTPWGGPPDVRSLVGSDRHLYANVHVGGILRGDLLGSRWEPTIEIGADVHEVATNDPDGNDLSAATAKGLARSTDRGESWTFIEGGLHAPYSRAIALGDDALFMTASDGPFGGRAAVYRLQDEEDVFTKCDRGLPEWFEGNIDTGCLATSGSRVAFGTEDGRVFLSADQGNSWEEAATGLSPVRWVEAGPD